MKSYRFKELISLINDYYDNATSTEEIDLLTELKTIVELREKRKFYDTYRARVRAGIKKGKENGNK